MKGDFETSFTEADNSKILPTDTMKNTVYYVARGSKAATIEEFAMEYGDYLLANNRASLQALRWRLKSEGLGAHDCGWRAGSNHIQTRRAGGADCARRARPRPRMVDRRPASMD